MGWSASIQPRELLALLGSGDWPQLLDVRRANAFDSAEDLLPTARWADYWAASSWGPALAGPPMQAASLAVVVYCAHGEQLSQGVAALLRGLGIRVRYLEGGISAWRSAGGPTLIRAAVKGLRPEEGPSVWITHDRPDAITLACCWLIRRFIDPRAVFHFAAEDLVGVIAADSGAIPFDVAEAQIYGDQTVSSFDRLLGLFHTPDPALATLAAILRGYVKNSNDGEGPVAAETAGLRAVVAGLHLTARNEDELLARGMMVIDGLYALSREGAAHLTTSAAASPAVTKPSVATQATPTRLG